MLVTLKKEKGGPYRNVRQWTIAGILALGLTACSTSSDREPALGIAFVGPVTLQVRDELAARAELTATLKHGERVDIIGRRRRFYKVRTGSGAEGWVDGRQLLTPDDMEALQELAARAKEAPSQGRAGVFEPLNVHTLPNRQAPSFFQITADAQADVIAHERVPRVVMEAPEFIPAPPVPAARKKKRKKEPEVPPPPAPKPPGLPKDWMAMSGHAEGAGLSAPERKVAPTTANPGPATGPSDDWSLIRAKDGRAGWVLTRLLLMSIPDEVAQYAERARIAAYFSLGNVNDRGVDKPVWLWATLSQRGVEHDFDNLRIFTWSTRRHRYETSFIEKGLQGHLPIRVYGEPGQGVKGFRVVVVEKSGERVERDYALQGYRARVVARRAPPAQQKWHAAVKSEKAGEPPPEEPKKGWADRWRSLVDGIKSRFRR